MPNLLSNPTGARFFGGDNAPTLGNTIDNLYYEAMNAGFRDGGGPTVASSMANGKEWDIVWKIERKDFEEYTDWFQPGDTRIMPISDKYTTPTVLIILNHTLFKIGDARGL